MQNIIYHCSILPYFNHFVKKKKKKVCVLLKSDKMEVAGYISNDHASLELCVCLGEGVALGCAVSVCVYGEICSILCILVIVGLTQLRLMK